MKSLPEYNSWHGAKGRCYNLGDPAFANHGGRGITMASECVEDFARFLADMGPRPPGTSLDRYPDPTGPYAPGNCRWATAREQSHNRRAPVVGASARATCEACGAPMAERKGKRACSAKCRAVLSRRRHDDVRQARDQEVRALLEAALGKLGGLRSGV